MKPKSKWNLESLKEYFERVLSERRVAMEAALVSQKDSVAAAFAASDKAITKAEESQKEYNARSNEFRAALADQSKTFLSRAEADTRLEQLRDLIESQAKLIVELQKFESRGEGGSKASERARSLSQWIIALTVTVILSVLGGIGSLIFFLATRP